MVIIEEREGRNGVTKSDVDKIREGGVLFGFPRSIQTRLFSDSQPGVVGGPRERGGCMGRAT